MTHAEASTLLWVNVGVSSALAVLLIALSPVVVLFYNEPRLIWQNIVLSFSMLTGGLRVQHSAILRRQMRFGVFMVVDLIALVFGITLGICMAWRRSDYWALAGMHIGTIMASCLGTWLVCGWRPGLPSKLITVRTQLRFGIHLLGSQALLFLTGNLDNVLVGRYWGPVELGLYARGYQLLLLPVQQVSVPIGHVAIPTLSRLQAEPERFRRYYCRALNFMAFSIVPFIAVLAALAHEIVLLLLGPAWTTVAMIFQALAIAAVIEPFMSSGGWIMIANGRAGRLFTWSILGSPAIFLSFVIGLPWGGLGVAVAYSIARCVLVIPSMWFAMRGTAVSPTDVLAAIWRPFGLAALLYATVAGVRFLISDWSPTVIVGLSLIAGLVVCSAALGLWPRARAEALGLANVIRKILVRTRPIGSMGAIER